MKLVLTIIGVLVGASILEEEGVIVGGVIGFLSGMLLQMRDRLNALESKLEHLIQAPTIEKDDTTNNGWREAETQNVEPIHKASDDTTSPELTIIDDTTNKNSITQNHSQQTQAEPKPTPTYTSSPDPISRFLKNFFTTGNVVAKVGVLILFIGVSFLVHYAAQRNVFPIELRLISIAVGACVMFGFGWRLREKRRQYGLLLQGGAIGILYITTFAASSIFYVIPLGLAFAILFALVIFSCLIAVKQDAKVLACFASVGGFLAPILISSGSGNHIALFSYYALLNAGIVSIAWFKSWRILNWIGFIFTFTIASLWGYKAYNPEHFATTEPFLILYFIFYIAIAVLFAHRQPPKLKGFVDATIVFGTPIVGFFLQAELVEGTEYGLAISAFVIGLIYFALAKALWHKPPEGMRTLAEAFLALGVIFATITIPLAFDGRWTAAAWSLEGAGMIWIGLRQNRLLVRLFGLLLQILAAGFFLEGVRYGADPYPIVNAVCFGSVLMSISGLFSSYQYHQREEKISESAKIIAFILLAWGILWWMVAGVSEIERYARNASELNFIILYLALSLLLLSFVARKLNWHQAELSGHILLPVLAMVCFVSFIDRPSRNIFANYGYISWPIAFIVQYILMYRLQQSNKTQYLTHTHTATLWLFTFVMSWVVFRSSLNHLESINQFAYLAWGIVPIVMMILLWSLRFALQWPINQYENSYLGNGYLVIAVCVNIWIVMTCFQNADPSPLPYIPVLNPHELVQLVGIAVSLKWLREWQLGNISGEILGDFKMWFIGIALVAFAWLNAVVTRSVHYFADVPYRYYDMFHSDILQTSLTLVWTLLAFILMGLATKRGIRALWFVGVALLAIVVAKLFMVDMGDSGTVTRIVSFMSVGVLMLVINYFAPIPPKEPEK